MAEIEIRVIGKELTQAEINRIRRAKAVIDGHAQVPNVINGRIIKCGRLSLRDILSILQDLGCQYLNPMVADAGGNRHPVRMRDNPNTSGVIAANPYNYDHPPSEEDGHQIVYDRKMVEYQAFLEQAPPIMAENLKSGLSFIAGSLTQNQPDTDAEERIELKPWHLVDITQQEGRNRLQASFDRLGTTDPVLGSALREYVTVYNPSLGNEFLLNRQTETRLLETLIQVTENPVRTQNLLQLGVRP